MIPETTIGAARPQEANPRKFASQHLSVPRGPGYGNEIAVKLAATRTFHRVSVLRRVHTLSQ